MTRVTGQSIPPEMLASGAWPLSTLNPMYPQNGVIHLPAGGPETAWENIASWRWQTRLRWARAVMHYFPGLDGHSSPSARLANIMAELMDNNFDSRFWRQLAPSVDRTLTSYYDSNPTPPGGPLNGPLSAWYWYTTGTTPPTPYDKTPGWIVNDAGGVGQTEYLCWRRQLYTPNPHLYGGGYRPLAIVGQLSTSVWAANYPTWTTWLTQFQIGWQDSAEWGVWDYHFLNGTERPLIRPPVKYPPGPANPWSGAQNMSITLDPVWQTGYKDGLTSAQRTLSLSIFNPYKLPPYNGYNTRQTRDIDTTLTAYQLAL